MEDLPARIDHTVLGPSTTPADVDEAVATAADLGTNVCVPPGYVARAASALDERDARGRDPAVVTVIGFPHGQNASPVRRHEAALAADDGADELDVVMDVGRLLGGEPSAVESDLAGVLAAVDVPVKAIVCAPLLTDAGGGALETACEIAADVGCSHVKTATGFNGGGASVEAVERMADYLPVKASGGIGSWPEARAMLDAGAERIGASSGDVIVEEWRAAIVR